MNRFNHFIVTRFNVNVSYADPRIRLDPEWLRHRFALFDRFCYPSVRGQSSHNFTWLVLFDSDTPDIFKQKVQEYSQWDNFIPVYMAASNVQIGSITRHVITNYMSEGVRRIVTTRLDNDDALHRNFVQTLQDTVSHKNEHAREFINFTRGYVWHNSKVYLTHQKSNPFISLVENASDFRTIYCGVAHTQYFTVAPVREVMIPPLWLQVVHETNISNTVQGVRRPIKCLRNFAIDGTIPTPSD